MAQEFSIRLAKIEDMKNVFDLSNDGTVRQNSIHTEKIEWGNHIKWFNSKLNSKDCIFYVAYENKDFVGYCHLHLEDGEWIVTIHISKNMRHKGYGKKLLQYVCRENLDKSIISYVKVKNIPSYNLFKKNNFYDACKEIIGNTECYKFEYRPAKYIIAISNDLYNNTKIFNKENIIVIKNKEDLTFEKLKEINPKYIFFPHWSFIIPAEIYENFNCIIFHMTDLPFGRGGSPLQNLIERGIYKTKISAIKCIKELDAGDIYMKKDLDISYGTAQEIYSRAGEIISTMIDEIIEKEPIPIPQEGPVVEFKRRKPEDSNIQNLSSINKIYDYIRMLDAEGYPKAFLETNNMKFEFRNAKLKKGKLTAEVEIKVKDE